MVRQLLRAHEYWRLKLLAVDLVIINEQGATYADDLQDGLEALVRKVSRVWDMTPTRATEVCSSCAATRSPRRTAPCSSPPLGRTARPPWTTCRSGHAPRASQPPAGAADTQTVASQPVEDSAAAAPPELEFFNGLGGFGEDGREYVTVLGPGQSTPAPWLNVIANQSFGFQVSESGCGYTWAENSRENKLTAWSNDPVSDPASEALYVRDDDTGDVWCPTAQPIRCEGRPTSPTTVPDTAASSTCETASFSTSCSSSHSTSR